MKTKIITEGKTKLLVYESKLKSKRMPVFYNEARVYPRDLTIVLLKALNFSGSMLDLLAAGGARGVRALNETKVHHAVLNDLNPQAVEHIKENLKLNKLKNAEVFGMDANKFLYTYNKSFDYIDIDPFGSYIPYINASVKYLKNNSLLGVAEFHKAVLTGAYPKKCLRQFGSWIKRVGWKEEMGLRVMIKDIMLQGAKHEKALTPIYSEDLGDHYRVFFRCVKGAKRTDDLLKKIGFVDEIGPMWLGGLWDAKLLAKMKDVKPVILDESKIDAVGFVNTHYVAKELKLKSLPKIEKVIDKLKKLRFKASRTHFSPYGIKTDAPKEKVKEVIRNLQP